MVVIKITRTNKSWPPKRKRTKPMTPPPEGHKQIHFKTLLCIICYRCMVTYWSVSPELFSQNKSTPPLHLQLRPFVQGNGCWIRVVNGFVYEDAENRKHGKLICCLVACGWNEVVQKGERIREWVNFNLKNLIICEFSKYHRDQSKRHIRKI